MASFLLFLQKEVAGALPLSKNWPWAKTRQELAGTRTAHVDCRELLRTHAQRTTTPQGHAGLSRAGPAAAGQEQQAGCKRAPTAPRRRERQPSHRSATDRPSERANEATCLAAATHSLASTRAPQSAVSERTSATCQLDRMGRRSARGTARRHPQTSQNHTDALRDSVRPTN